MLCIKRGFKVLPISLFITITLIIAVVVNSRVFNHVGALGDIGAGIKLEGILTNDPDDIFDPNLGKDEPLREGMYAAIEGKEDQQKIHNLLSTNELIDNHENATYKTIKIVSNLINYMLGLASLVALVILLIAGIKMILAAGDQKAIASGIAKLKKVGIALVGVGLSWVLVSFIFWLLKLIL